MKRIFISIGLGVASCSFAIIQPQGSDPFEILAKAFSSQRSVRATLIQNRSDRKTNICVLVQIVPGVGIQSKVLQPFVYAGIVSFDDGKSWTNYDPSENTIRIEKSPLIFESPVESRLALIKENYTIKLENPEKVAGRLANVISFKAIHQGMSDRQLTIDKETSLILGYEIRTPGQEPIQAIATRSIEVGQPGHGLGINIEQKPGATVKKSWGPEVISSVESAQKLVGFSPKLPTQFPAGLHLQAIHAIGHEEIRFIGIRLTDGMAMVTVYLWNSNGKKNQPFNGEFDSSSPSGMKVRVEGELTDWIRKELARELAKIN